MPIRHTTSANSSWPVPLTAARPKCHRPVGCWPVSDVRYKEGTRCLAPTSRTGGRSAQFTDPAGAMFAVWQPGNTRGLGTLNDPGSLCWTELVTPDVPAAKSFYSDVLGWETDDQPMGEFTYTVVRPAGGSQDSGQGGIMPLSPEMAAAGAATRWQPYFEVADCDAVAAAVTANGGTVVVPASDVPGVGRFAVALDPDGAQFAVIASVPA